MNPRVCRTPWARAVLIALFCSLIGLAPRSSIAQSAVAVAAPTAANASSKLVADTQQAVLSVKASPAGGGATTYSLPVQTLLLFSALSFLPAVLLLMTSFTRIIIVLSLMRQALGLQTTPPNQVLVGMALFLTLFVMGPTVDRINNEAYQPFSEQKITFNEAIERGSNPLRLFMMKQTREADLALFARMAQIEEYSDSAQMPLRVMIPAFVISELKTAFQIGFLVFIPFLIIDMIVASILMSMGMMMLSPVLVALPFKLMLFVLADGWNLMIGSLVASFGTH
jgi:flagellar biosynthesis protein FliP